MKTSHRVFLVAVILAAPHVSAWVAIPLAALFIALALGAGGKE